MPWKFKAVIFSQGIFDLTKTNTNTNTYWAHEFGSLDNEVSLTLSSLLLLLSIYHLRRKKRILNRYHH